MREAAGRRLGRRSGAGLGRMLAKNMTEVAKLGKEVAAGGRLGGR